MTSVRVYKIYKVQFKVSFPRGPPPLFVYLMHVHTARGGRKTATTKRPKSAIVNRGMVLRLSEYRGRIVS